MVKITGVIIVVMLVVAGTAAIFLLSQPSKDCRFSVEVKTGPALTPAINVEVSVHGGPKGFTGPDGRLTLGGITCGQDVIIDFGGGSWQRRTDVVIPEFFVLGPRDIEIGRAHV